MHNGKPDSYNGKSDSYNGNVVLSVMPLSMCAHSRSQPNAFKSSTSGRHLPPPSFVAFVASVFVHPSLSKFMSSTNATPTTTTTHRTSRRPPTARVVFSDLDGTLVHYPKSISHYADVVDDNVRDKGRALIRYRESGEERECYPLSSTTGGVSYISLRTHKLISKLRELGVTFVIITGARASTYAARRANLPAADFEFFENGGRKIINGSLDHSWSDSFLPVVGPIPHVTHLAPPLSMIPKPIDRTGTLWDVYRTLHNDGWKLDARDYTTNMRVDVDKSEGKSAEDYQRVIDTLIVPNQLATSFNLGKADIYPKASGKANAASHILHNLNVHPNDAVALFDDDNDIELGLLCGASFLPGVTHESVLQAKKDNPWTVMDRPGFLGTEDALELVIKLRENAIQSGKDSISKVPS